MNTKSRRRGFAAHATGAVPELPAANPPAGYRSRAAPAYAPVHETHVSGEPAIALGQGTAIALLQIVLEARTQLRAQIASAPTDVLRAKLRQVEASAEELSKALVTSA